MTEDSSSASVPVSPEGSASSNEETCLLIIDADPLFRESIRKEGSILGIEPIFAPTFQEAEALLLKRGKSFLAVFVAIAPPEGAGVAAIRSVHQHVPGTPILVLRDPKLDVTDEQLKQLGVSEVIIKPTTYAKMMESVKPILLMTGASPVPSAQEKSEEDKNYIPIQAANFVSGAASSFELFVRISSKKYLKVLHVGDSFSAERIQSYLDKGLESFFLKKEAQEQYLKHCDELAQRLFKDPKATLKVQATQVLGQGRETLDFLKKNGVSEENLKYVTSFSKNIQDLVGRIDPKGSALKAFLANLAAYDHGSGTAMLASLLAKQMGIEADKFVHLVGFAALLHDIGLYELPEACHAEDESKMTPEEIKLFHTHPERGMEILKKVNGIFPVALQAVAQHHERPNRGGFPHGLRGSSINNLAEIIGFADEFDRLIRKNKTVATFDPIKGAEELIFPAFSQRTIHAFKLAFPSAPSTPSAS